MSKKAELLASTMRAAKATDLPTNDIWHMSAGIELGFLRVIDDEAYKKSARRTRQIVVYTTPEERRRNHQLK